MNEMIRYIFESMQLQECLMKNVKKTLKMQTKMNVCLTLFTVVSTACMITAEMKRLEMMTEIKALKDEIEELKHVEGV